jgi:hypothetical protein
MRTLETEIENGRWATVMASKLLVEAHAFVRQYRQDVHTARASLAEAKAYLRAINAAAAGIDRQLSGPSPEA